MKKTRVAINGFGRIGRTFLRMAIGNPDFDVVAINDLGDLENLAYLLTYDTAYGRSPHTISIEGDNLVVDGAKISFLSTRDPKDLPWKDLDIDVVVEATGIFASYEKSKVHLESGAKRVVISAPVKDDPAAANVEGATVLMGINEDVLSTCQVSSNASCTTNAVSPLVAILKNTVGIEKAILNTVHAYTPTQALIDAPNKKDFRKGRSAAQNIIPSTTGAAIATTKAHPDLENKFDGIAMRVPVAVGSIVDLTFVTSKDTTVKEVNQILRDASKASAWKTLFAVTDEPIVSSDIIGAQFAAIADLSFTKVVGGNLVKVLAWYDNETSYTSTLVQHVAAISKFFQTKQ